MYYAGQFDIISGHLHAGQFDIISGHLHAGQFDIMLGHLCLTSRVGLSLVAAHPTGVLAVGQHPARVTLTLANHRPVGAMCIVVKARQVYNKQ